MVSGHGLDLGHVVVSRLGDATGVTIHLSPGKEERVFAPLLTDRDTLNGCSEFLWHHLLWDRCSETANNVVISKPYF